MSTERLFLDVGNSRLKWMWQRRSGIGDAGAMAHEGEPAAALRRMPAARPAQVWVAQVTGAGHAQSLSAAIVEHFGCEPQFAKSAAQWRELRSAYVEPERLGVDRWLVMIAAWAESKGAACVVDAGTALTVDAVSAEGQHLGGIIAAGLSTQQRAVLGHTRFATRQREPDYHGGLGTETEACVSQGAMLACLGAIDRASAIAGDEARKIITGGDAPLLLPYLGTGWEHRPLLVLDGLRSLADDR